MHTVTLNPTAVTITPGGPAATIVATVENVPEDVAISQTLSFEVGTSNVDLNLTVNVDNPQPVVSGIEASSEYTLSFGTPVQDATTSTTWTVEITVTPV